MDGNYLKENPFLNGGTKKIVRESTHTERDENGDLKHVVIDEDAYVGAEPDYIKIYTGTMLAFNHLDTALTPYIIAFGKWMTYANFENPAFRCTVRTGEIERRDVAKCCRVSDSQVKKAIRKLIDAEIFIPVEIEGKKKRGIYFVNPWVMSKGDWKDIKQLRTQFEFVTGAQSTMSISSDGERHIIMPLTVNNTELLEDGE